jgi:hypothetical protein
MIQCDLFQTIRELCESALYLYSVDKIGHAHQLLDHCEELLAMNGLSLPVATGGPHVLLN